MASNIDLKAAADSQPTEVLATRFEAWHKVVKSLSTYLKEFAYAQDEVSRLNSRLENTATFPSFQATPNAIAVEADKKPSSSTVSNAETSRDHFMPPGSDSIADVSGILSAFHKAQSSIASRASQELTTNVIPRLEDIEQDLLAKIKEIRALAPDFNNSVSKHQDTTSKEIKAYSTAIETVATKPAALHPKNDPYLLKGSLDKQINRQVKEENYLLEALINIQASGKELETVIVQEIQRALSTFGKLTGLKAGPLQDLSNKITSGFPTKDPTYEWNHFVTREGTFVPPETKPRDAQAVSYPGQESNLASKVRSGYLERRSKYLKSYSKAWYVLTPLYLHEFKSPDQSRDPHPALSLPLGDCKISHDKKGSSSDSHRFIINVGQAGSSKGHNWVFRAESKEQLDGWFNDLTALSQIDHPAERANKYFPPAEKSVEVQDPPLTGPVTPAAPIAIVGGSTAAPLGTPGSPAFSDSSEVTSLGDPFDTGHIEEESLPVTSDESDRRPGPPGRFPSDVGSYGYSAEPTDKVSGFVLPSEIVKQTEEPDIVSDDNSSVFSYDLKKETHSTLPDDTNFKPINSDTPVFLERRLTMTNHKDEPNSEGGIGVARGPDDSAELDHKTAIMRRRSSVASTKSGPRRNSTLSRKATGSYGMDDLRPLTTTSEQPQNLFFASGLPDTTSSGPATSTS